MLNKDYFKTKNIIVKVNSKKYTENVLFTIWYKDPIIPISVDYEDKQFPFELIPPKAEVAKMLKKTGLDSDRFLNFYFDDNKFEIGWVWKGMSYFSKIPKKQEKSFEITFLKEKDYEKVKGFIQPHLEIKGKFYQQIKQ